MRGSWSEERPRSVAQLLFRGQLDIRRPPVNGSERNTKSRGDRTELHPVVAPQSTGLFALPIHPSRHCLIVLSAV
jgi:hypothetical protein